MTNETSKNLKVVDDEKVLTAKVEKTRRGQYAIYSGDIWGYCFSPNDGWGEGQYAFPSEADAEKALAEWKAANIPWVTPEQKIVCAKESDLAAIECDIVRWRQIAIAGLAVCDGFKTSGCSIGFRRQVIRGESGPCVICDSKEYHTVVDAYSQKNADAFQKAVNALVDMIEAERASLAVGDELENGPSRPQGDTLGAFYVRAEKEALRQTWGNPMWPYNAPLRETETKEHPISVNLSKEEAERVRKVLYYAGDQWLDIDKQISQRIADSLARHEAGRV